MVKDGGVWTEWATSFARAKKGEISRTAKGKLDPETGTSVDEWKRGERGDVGWATDNPSWRKPARKRGPSCMANNDLGNRHRRT